MIHDSNGLTILGALARGAGAPGEHPDQRRFLSHPEPGFFAFRLVKDGPWCPAVIYIPCPMVEPDVFIHHGEWCRDRERFARDYQLRAKVIDRDHAVEPIWIHGRFVPYWRWRHMMAVFAWAKREAPNSPEARPTRPVDPRTVRTALHV